MARRSPGCARRSAGRRRRAVALPSLPTREPLRIDGGTVALGRAPDEPGFAFDNEQPTMPARLAPFEIDATPLRNAEFVAFVEAGGYDDATLWPGPAGAWRAAPGELASLALAPRRRRAPGRCAGSIDGCRSTPRRRSSTSRRGKPRRIAAGPAGACRTRRSGSTPPRDARFVWGRGVWEWTADAFLPYPGFVAGPYADYSRPWFGDHRELRGGAFATAERLHDPRYRNFFVADRNDVFAGFRTAALLPR